MRSSSLISGTRPWSWTVIESSLKEDWSLANVIEERGQFWWFGEDGQTSSLAQAVHGLLTINDEGLISLELEGALFLEDPKVSWDWDASRWLADEKRIVGRL